MNRKINIEIDGDLVSMDDLIDLYLTVKKSLNQNKNPDIFINSKSLIVSDVNLWETLGEPRRRQFSIIKHCIDSQIALESDFLNKLYNCKCLLLSDKRVISPKEYCDKSMIIIGIVIDAELKLAVSIDEFGYYNTWKNAMWTAANYYTPGTKQGDWELPSLEYTEYILNKYKDSCPWLMVSNILFGNIPSHFWTSSQFSMHSSYYCTGLVSEPIAIKSNDENGRIMLILRY